MHQEKRPQKALARIQGGPLAPQIRGMVYFFASPGGTWVYSDVTPGYRRATPWTPLPRLPHSRRTCAVDVPGSFSTGGQNPDAQPHGNHAGDFPVLFSNDGKATIYFFTQRFRVWEVIGRSVLIHENPDDYRTQPSGNSGRRLACGVIRPFPGE